ncbi:MAG: hypothetical protein IT209_09840 [Armatimonadetes bacterium]|nr:hypothetical protein [Armatimonadota bacterium]
MKTRAVAPLAVADVNAARGLLSRPLLGLDSGHLADLSFQSITGVDCRCYQSASLW